MFLLVGVKVWFYRSFLLNIFSKKKVVFFIVNLKEKVVRKNRKGSLICFLSKDTPLCGDK